MVMVVEDMNEADAASFKDEVRRALAAGEVAVTFTKADGSQRVLRGTTNLDYVPASSHPKGLKPENPDVQPVWDLEKGEWRSFRWDRVSDYRIL
jgi:hypothetical protein